METQLATIPRKQNMQTESLAMFSSTCKLPFQPNHRYNTEIRHRTTILDNLKNWQVFDSDKQINNFLTLDEEFSNLKIDIETVTSSNQINEVDINISEENSINMLHPTKFIQKEIQDLKQMGLDEIIEEETEVNNLKDNHLQNGLTPLEDLFDSNDIPKKLKMKPLKAYIEEYNLGTQDNPKLIKLSKSLPLDQKLKYVELMREFQDVFS